MPEGHPPTPVDIPPQIPAACQQELASLLADIRRTFAVHFEPMEIDGEALHLLSVDNMPRHIDTLLEHQAIRDPLRDLPLWAKVWPASFILGRYLGHYVPACDIKGQNLLELGAGCGATSLVASRYGFAGIVISDVDENALRFARANVLYNSLHVPSLHDLCSVRRVDVTSTRLEARFKYIVAAEILYLESLHRPLLNFVKRHLAEGGQALFCTDVIRRQWPFRKLAGEMFHVSDRVVTTRCVDEEDGTEEHLAYIIYILERP